MADVGRLTEYINPADYLTDVSSKAELAECARLLAMNVAQYKQRFGEVRLEDSLNALYAADLTPEITQLVADGMEELVGVPGAVRNGSACGEDVN